MTIQISVTDPAKAPRAHLAIAIALLQAFHDGERAVQALADKLNAGAPAPVAPALPATITPTDSPDAGAEIPNPTAAFGTPANVGNVQVPAAAGNVDISAQTSLSLPPAAPSAPSAAPANVTAGGVELDKRGLPWDSRIHAGTKTKKADGTWTARRGVEPSLVVQVEAELQALMGIPTPAVSGNAAAAAFGAPPAPTGGSATPPPAPITPPAPPAAGVPAITFAELAGKVSEWVAANRLTQEQLTGAVSTVGVSAFGLLFNRPDLVPAAHVAIKQMIGEA